MKIKGCPFYKIMSGQKENQRFLNLGITIGDLGFKRIQQKEKERFC